MLHEFLGTPAPVKIKPEEKTLTLSIQFVQQIQRPRKNRRDEILMHVKILDHDRHTKISILPFFSSTVMV